MSGRTRPRRGGPTEALRWLLPAFVLAACAPEPPAATPGVSDSAGIRIVVSAPARPSLERWRLGPEPVVELGDGAGPPEALLENVRGAVRLADGSIAVADGGWQEIRVFAPDGRFLRSVGRRGGGPGEFRALAALRILPGDTLVAYDARADRVSWFSPRGELVREATLPLRGYGVRIHLFGPFPGDAFVAAVGLPREGAAEGPVRDSTLLLLVRAGSQRPDTLGWTPAIELYRTTMREGDGPTATLLASPPLWRRLHLAAGPDRLFLGHDGSFDIRALEPGGAGGMRIRMAVDPRRVEDRELDRWKKAYLAEGLESWRKLRERAVRNARYPGTEPAHGELFADREGNLWVARFVPPGDTVPITWRVFGPEGRLRATVETPAGARLLDAGRDYLLLAVTDELDVPRVRLYRLVRGGALANAGGG